MDSSVLKSAQKSIKKQNTLMTIFASGFPKSGNTWLATLVDHTTELIPKSAVWFFNSKIDVAMITTDQQ